MKSYWSRLVSEVSTKGCSSAGKAADACGTGDDEVDLGEVLVEVALAPPDEPGHLLGAEAGALGDPVDVGDLHADDARQPVRPADHPIGMIPRPPGIGILASRKGV